MWSLLWLRAILLDQYGFLRGQHQKQDDEVKLKLLLYDFRRKEEKSKEKSRGLQTAKDKGWRGGVSDV